MMRPEELEALREEAKEKYFNGTGEEKSEGLAKLLEAARCADPEANYLVGKLLLTGTLTVRGGDREKTGLSYLTFASDLGCQEARLMVNAICQQRYQKAMDERALAEGRTAAAARQGQTETAQAHPLTDFSYQPVKIDRKGVFVPVDAKLTFENGENLLKLSANLKIVSFDENCTEEEDEAFAKAVVRGIRDWEGTYRVFEDQKVTVSIDLTFEDRLLDNVTVLKIDDKMAQQMDDIYEKLPQIKRVKNVRSTIQSRRSFAMIGAGAKWSVSSPKYIWMLSSEVNFRDLEKVRNTAKHEFGHVLGLGDLYEDDALSLAGVETNRYAELDAFHLYDRRYHQVMCDSSAPVSNNDIEMVILAFSKNRYQRFQPDQTGEIVSDALGLGN